MKVLIAGGGSGGHLIPAIALAEGFRRWASDVQPVIVGAERGVDREILSQRNFPYHLIPAEPLYRRSGFWKNLRLPFTAVRVWGAVGRILRTEEPALVVGTGGYVAGPVLFRAHRQGIPTAIQEQNAVPGLATRWLARIAAQIHLGFPEAAAHLKVRKGTEVLAFGNPVRPMTPGDRESARVALGLDPKRPVVFAFGGSQGARAINEALAGALTQGQLHDVSVLWGTGPSHYTRFNTLSVPGRVVVRGFFDPIDDAYSAADLVVARAGAMTIAELCAWGLPSILVPLPTAAADHQTHNANALAQAGAAVHLAQSSLTGERLATDVRDLIVDRDRLHAMGALARGRGQPEATKKVVSKLLTLVS
jgi:UDP-N-acetylglucosamine--N-acetylmuramyl-(pentapeptide) pyrophosphoryl-undecaprenol N-acetylglucosamine transferase